MTDLIESATLTDEERLQASFAGPLSEQMGLHDAQAVRIATAARDKVLKAVAAMLLASLGEMGTVGRGSEYAQGMDDALESVAHLIEGEVDAAGSKGEL